MFQDIPIVGSGFWAEVKAGGQHLRLFVVETMLGLGANVFSVTDSRWLDAGPHWFQTFGEAKQWAESKAQTYLQHAGKIAPPIVEWNPTNPGGTPV